MQEVFSSDFIDSEEQRRLECVSKYQALISDHDNQFDAISRLIAYVCGASGAFITLIDDKVAHVKSAHGFQSGQCTREDALCNYTIRHDGILEIPDLTKDARSAQNIFVKGEPHLRFYAGAPLVSPDGCKIGSLCVVDLVPRSLNSEQRDVLSTMAGNVMALLELNLKNRELHEALGEGRQFEELFNNSADLHCITDTEGTILYVNKAMRTLLGYDEKSVIGHNIWEYAPAGERDKVMPHLYDAINQGTMRFEFESDVYDHRGNVRRFEWSDILFNGKWLVNGRDITVRKESEKKLEYLSFAIQKSPAGVVIRRASGEIEWVNEASERILGYSSEELQGRTIGDLLEGELTNREVTSYMRSQVEKKLPYEVELIVYRKDKTPVWAYVSNTPIADEHGEVYRYVGVIVDITLRKQAEEQLVKTRQEAIDLSKSKEVFISVLSHEIRTPLNAILGIADILKNDQALPGQAESFEILTFSAQNLLHLINDVLDFTKAETGNIVLEDIPLDLRQLASSCIDSLRYKVQDKEVQLRCSIDPSVPDKIMGDPTRLYQIFINILGNAVRFTERGSVELNVSVGSQDSETIELYYTFTDTGIGIAQDKLQSIFDAYSQAGEDITRKYGGTGLGLAITRKLVRLHHSEIFVESELNVGSRFSFTIKHKKLSEQTSSDLDVSEEPVSAHVLVVDDNSINRLIAQKVLKRWGVSSDFAENGIEAVELIKRNHYDIIFMDIFMPLMDGFEATRVIRDMEDGKYKDLPILALTASVAKEDIDNILVSGMNDFVLKPFEPGMLYKKIRKMLA